MNKWMQNHYPTFAMYQALRNQLMELLTDADLTHRFGDNTLTLGELCRESGEIEYSYLQSLKVFTQNFDYRHPEPDIALSVTKLKAWFAELDAELKSVLENFSDDEMANKLIVRGVGFELPVHIQIDVYKEVLLLFAGKASIYLRAFGKEFPEQWQSWVG